MNTNAKQLLHLAQHPEELNRDTLYKLRNLLTRYPYFTLIRILYLHNLYLLREPSFNEELRLAALTTPDRARLFDLIEGPKYESKVTQPIKQKEQSDSVSIATKMDQESRTLSLINQFLLGLPEKDNLTPIDLSEEYTAYTLESEEKPPVKKEYIKTIAKQEKDEEEDIIFSENNLDFEKKLEVSQPTEGKKKTKSKKAADDEEDEKDEKDLDESYFTETLAKIYVKQKRYDKALEIIRSINLKNPKKSAYFADQIRFLEKLLQNNK
ncbi:MAG: tetratricopeptide repeat protein [Bacteroidaceae bacterium]